MEDENMDLDDYFAKNTFTDDAHQLAVDIADTFQGRDLKNGEFLGALAILMGAQLAGMPASPGNVAQLAYAQYLFQVVVAACTHPELQGMLRMPDPNAN